MDRRITRRGVENYLLMGLKAYQVGEKLGQELQRNQEDLETLIKREQLSIIKKEELLMNSLDIRAWLDTGKKEIILFMPALKQIEEQLPWTSEDLVPIALAHEYFHYLQTQGKVDFLKDKWSLGRQWGIFPVRTLVFDEIAAFGFARGILRLPYSPLVIDYYMASKENGFSK